VNSHGTERQCKGWKFKAMILDVGCGTPSIYHQSLKGKNIIHIDINKNAKHLDIQCSVYNLPFQNMCFSIVYASHIIEHLDNPTQAIQEMKRVSIKTVIIKVPNASYYKWKSSSKEHIFSWNKYTLRNFLERHFMKVVINGTQRDISTSRFRKSLSLFLCLLHGHNELTAICGDKK